MQIIVRCFTPEYYDGCDHAVIEITPALVDYLARRIPLARKLKSDDNDFWGIKYTDYSPTFIALGDSEKIGQADEDFDAAMDANHCVILPDNFKLDDFDEARMSPIVLTITAERMPDDQVPRAGFYWTGTDKYIGSAGRCETYELTEEDLYEWAEALGFGLCKSCGNRVAKGEIACTDCK